MCVLSSIDLALLFTFLILFGFIGNTSSIDIYGVPSIYLFAISLIIQTSKFI